MLFRGEPFGLIAPRSPPSIAAAGLLVDTLSVQPLAIFSLVSKLRAGHTGAAFRLRRATGGETDIGYTADNLVDWADALAYCVGTDGFVTAWYDNMSGARHYTQALTASQPKVIAAGVANTFSTGGRVMVFDNSDDYMFRTDAFGLSGNPDVSIMGTFRTSIGGEMWHVGPQVAAGNRFGAYCSLTDFYNDYNGQNRLFTIPSSVNPGYVIHTHPAGGNAQSGTCRHNGVAVASTGGTGTVAMNLSNTVACLNAVYGLGAFTNLQTNVWGIFNAVQPAGDIAACEAYMAGALL